MPVSELPIDAFIQSGGGIGINSGREQVPPSRATGQHQRSRRRERAANGGDGQNEERQSRRYALAAEDEPGQCTEGGEEGHGELVESTAAGGNEQHDGEDQTAQKSGYGQGLWPHVHRGRSGQTTRQHIVEQLDHAPDCSATHGPDEAHSEYTAQAPQPGCHTVSVVREEDMPRNLTLLHKVLSVLAPGNPRRVARHIQGDMFGTTMTRLLAAEPQLYVRDLDVSVDYYTRVLGFSVAFMYGDPPFYGQVHRDGARLNLRHLDVHPIDPTLRDAEQLLTASIVLDDADQLFREYQRSGALIVQPLQDEAWGATTFVVADPDGNRLLFASSSSA